MTDGIVNKFERNSDGSQISVALSEMDLIVAISDCENRIVQTVI
jgi:hypothetical protein